jgi:hypothetical protein
MLGWMDAQYLAVGSRAGDVIAIARSETTISTTVASSENVGDAAHLDLSDGFFSRKRRDSWRRRQKENPCVHNVMAKAIEQEIGSGRGNILVSIVIMVGDAAHRGAIASKNLAFRRPHCGGCCSAKKRAISTIEEHRTLRHYVLKCTGHL